MNELNIDENIGTSTTNYNIDNFPKRPPQRIECNMNVDVEEKLRKKYYEFDLLFTRSQVYDDFSPASFDAKHWNMAESSINSFLINSEWSSCTAYLFE